MADVTGADAAGVEHQDVVFVTYHQLHLAAGDVPLTYQAPTNGLAGRSASGIVITTGIHTGPVIVTVYVSDSPPQHPDTAPEDTSWDEVVDIALDAGTEPLQVASLMNDVPSRFPPLNVSGAGRYRVRVHARGRDTDVDGAPNDPVETYLVHSWPDPEATDAVIRATDAVGAQTRRQAAHWQPQPDEPTGISASERARQQEVHDILLRAQRRRRGE